MYKHQELTRIIIGASMKIHREVGPGFQERVYHQALFKKLIRDGLKVEREVEYNVNFEGIWAGTFQLDLVIENLIVVELKAVSGDLPKLFQTQTISYLKASGLEVVLLINFCNESLNVKRFANYKRFKNL